MPMVRVTEVEVRGLQAILRWGPQNFHTLTQDNKVKMWLKIYDKLVPDKLDVNVSLSESIKRARERAVIDVI